MLREVPEPQEEGEGACPSRSRCFGRPRFRSSASGQCPLRSRAPWCRAGSQGRARARRGGSVRHRGQSITFSGSRRCRRCLPTTPRIDPLRLCVCFALSWSETGRSVPPGTTDPSVEPDPPVAPHLGGMMASSRLKCSEDDSLWRAPSLAPVCTCRYFFLNLLKMK